MLHNKKIFLLLPFLFFLSCNTWQRTIKKGEIPAKKIWQGLINGDWSHFKYCHYNLSDSDLAEISLIPKELYRMDSLSLMDFSIDKSIKSLIHLDKTRVRYYLVRSGKIIGIFNAGINNSNWYNAGGYGCVDSTLGTKLLHLLKHNKLFLLKISTFPSYHSERTFNVYIDDNGEYMSLKSWGASIPLEQEMLDVKNQVERWNKGERISQ